ncbi:response regulator [Candidatus Burkholderia verschuerenii]|uniref:response regulator n=1 Tax=Candidatus Burkholderia verschuerenii TaxID=242163 RepID=UPI000AB58F0F
MVIVHAAAAVRAALIGLTSTPFGRRRHAHTASYPALTSSTARTHAASSRDADDSMRDTLERLPLAMLVLTRDGRIDFANASAEQLFGYARQELRGASADTIMPGLRTSIASADRADTLFARRKDRTPFLADVTLRAMHERAAPLMLAVVIDRTERDELRRNRQELAHLTRVSMLGELAASLGHELNQPLTAILSNAQAAQRFMNREPVDLDEMREILSDLVADTNRASEILRRIRALVKKGELELAPLSMAGVIGDVAQLVHSDAIQRGIRVVLDIDSPLPLVRSDKVQLQQVVLNLLLNAFDAMDDREGERIVTIAAARDGESRVRVSMRDQGHGLPDALADQLFKPFCTFKRDGLGLGLSISRSIVDMHGGRIWASNNADRGATFTFTLPTETVPPVVRARLAMSAPDALVYVVDDDCGVRRALTRLIVSAGYRVESFESAQAFLDDARLESAPACLILDMQLPGLSGLDLQRALNANSETLPIIFVTGHGDIPMTVSAMKAGATDFLAKPVSDAALLRAIETSLERSARAWASRSEIDAIHRRLDRLTPREREVLVLVVNGWLNKQVASELGTVEKTVKVHRARVMEKMEARSLAELVRLSDRAGIFAGADRAA